MLKEILSTAILITTTLTTLVVVAISGIMVLAPSLISVPGNTPLPIQGLTRIYIALTIVAFGVVAILILTKQKQTPKVEPKKWWVVALLIATTTALEYLTINLLYQEMFDNFGEYLPFEISVDTLYLYSIGLLLAVNILSLRYRAIRVLLTIYTAPHLFTITKRGDMEPLSIISESTLGERWSNIEWQQSSSGEVYGIYLTPKNHINLPPTSWDRLRTWLILRKYPKLYDLDYSKSKNR